MKANGYSSDWFSTFLDAVPPEQTLREAEFVHRQLAPASTVLDLPCGAGRHARLLAGKGHRVIAVDRNATLLGSVTAPLLHWVAADMRRLPLQRRSLDAIICLWQSFGYFSAEENAALLQEWATLTRTGGVLLLDLYDPRFIERHLGERRLELPRGAVRETRTVREGRLVVELAYEWNGGGDRFDWQLFTVAELRTMAASCGWQLVSSCCGFDPARIPDGSMARAQHVLVRA